MSTKLKYRLVVVLTVMGMLGLAFFGITALIDPVKLLPSGSVVNDSTTVFAQYMAVRNFAIIALMAVGLLSKKARLLGYVLLLNALVQIGDSVLGVVHQEVKNFIFPAIFAVLYLVSFRFLLHNENVLDK